MFATSLRMLFHVNVYITESGLFVEKEKPGAETQGRDTLVKPWEHVERNQPCFCYSPLAEPLPGFVGWDYSAGGAGDGAGKNPFYRKGTKCKMPPNKNVFCFLYLDVILRALNCQLQALTARFKCCHVQICLSATASGIVFVAMA